MIAAAAAAPAFAASGTDCARQSVIWSTYATNSQQGATLTATGATQPITVMIGASGSTTAANNLTARNTQQGAVSSYLALTLPTGTAQTETVTFTFSSPVTDLRFSLLDIDSATNSFYDTISLTAGFTYTQPTGTLVTGVGTTANPFAASNANTNVPPTSNAGNVDLVYAGPISVVSIRYAQQINNSTIPVVGISDLSFLRSGC